ncbi:MAG: two-component system response regulator [Bacteroidetes bacterium GWE2_41_25]|nr:MAG: two-component system response regulator [Bacteroidetes bacterium GWA2_40_15]OFX91900.1 MAG: two-component system response regulator [Bacteroidetes bacterium GWC2_40_22]OFY10744.1 MAG: two-component system response regulator [Bacteroidetes bacterium GWE2_41_25]OFY58522.1 MAG: two-component system response regulator [Bacteroidetes bacterium GWF2_41_9]HBH85330.1 two-component system response regulator [Bacteroidales bacterium]
MRKTRILWTDDEVEALKSHIFFLEEKGYEIDTCSNGNDTIDLVRQNSYDLIFLDENMPGLSGIETLRLIKEVRNDIPVVMITKSEEEDIMEAAIGSEIADYLIKPVKPNQVLLVIKKILDQRRLITEKTTTDYGQEFGRITSMISAASTFTDWTELYRKIVFWESELEKSTDRGMTEILRLQENEANNLFSKFIMNNYLNWLKPGIHNAPILSPSLFSEKIFPQIRENTPLFFILIDNLRYDQWRTISAELTGLYRIIEEDIYFSILPTTTQFSRNSIFAGMMPSAIAENMPRYWVNDDDEEGKNNFEEELFRNQLATKRLNYKWSYHKIHNSQAGKKVNEKVKTLLKNDINIMVFNFVDMLSHARTDIGVLRDLANEEPAYRSLTRSWFLHSPLFELLKTLAKHPVRVVFSTDHGTIRVQNPLKIIGDRNTSSNLRYKMGRNLDYDPRKVFELKDPEKAMLPKSNISSRYIFALNKDYLVYQNNFNHYAGYYKDTFQHGGISMQEIMLPVACVEPV